MTEGGSDIWLACASEAMLIVASWDEESPCGPLESVLEAEMFPTAIEKA